MKKVFVVTDGAWYDPHSAIHVFASRVGAEAFCRAEAERRSEGADGFYRKPWVKKGDSEWTKGFDYLEIEEHEVK